VAALAWNVGSIVTVFPRGVDGIGGGAARATLEERGASLAPAATAGSLFRLPGPIT
jgi:hypothetical protein